MSDLVTGDDMIALLVSEGGDEGATYAPGDRSPEALIARNADVLMAIRNPARGSIVDYHALLGGDELERMGYVSRPVYTAVACYALTDKGAAVARALQAV
ncbi:hypothetical protein DER29_0517 [Micromonospora sp. M71_S20]|uniref:hypothetical protein n=1 Tax=Micromonospora sp. M71_S20 TaxID=592872 RepID=UPI000EABD35C|nr:hypothetical protein [Micromonospora sp. M71_S20]RLK22678.1 hypothetical protein DER29_0517 [Micromonospora sp. M71_S20]